MDVPTICPIWPMDTLRGMARVEAPVLCRFAASQLSRGGIEAKENVTATQRRP